MRHAVIASNQHLNCDVVDYDYRGRKLFQNSSQGSSAWASETHWKSRISFVEKMVGPEGQAATIAYKLLILKP